MKLLYTLPDEAYQIISKIISSESILYCVPYDLDLENNFVEGWLVITKEMCFQIEDSTLKDQFQIDDCHKFEIELLIGNILLIGYDNATSYPILRATATHIQRYRYIVNILNTLSTGEIPQIESEDSERICSKCQSVLVEGTQSCPKCMKKEITYNRIRTLVQPHTLGLMVLALGTLAISLIEIFKTYLFRNLIDVYLVPMNPNFEGILLIFSLLFLAEGIKVLVETLKNRKVLTMGKEIVEMLRDTLFEKIMKIPLNKIETCGVGDLINRINNNTLTIKEFIVSFLNAAAYNGISFIVVSIFLCILNIKVYIIVVVTIPISILVARYTQNMYNRMSHKHWKALDACTTLLFDLMDGINVIKAFGMEKRAVENFKNENQRLNKVTIDNNKKGTLVGQILIFVTGISNFLVIFYIGNLVVGNQIGVGEFVQIMQYTSMLYGPISWFSSIPQTMMEMQAATERVYEIINEKNMNCYNAEKEVTITGAIELKNVSFGYKETEPIIKNVSLKVNPGEMIGIVGMSGMGKTTLINLIMGMYEVDSGEILIDGVNIKQISHKCLHQNMGVVTQQCFLKSGTILENIVYSEEEARPIEVVKAAQDACAHSFIMGCQNGYDTLIGNGQAKKFSTGQKQRIAIARAIYSDPKFLILDEATASVDTETEMKIQEALKNVVKGRTTFAIAHRLSTLKNADRLIVIECGRIVESGKHEELLAKKGNYYRMVMAQSTMHHRTSVNQIF